MRNQDRTFLKHFFMVLAGLAGLTLVLILLARQMQQALPEREPSAESQAEIQARIEPLGAVHAGETGAAAIAASARTAASAVAGQVAYEGTLDGELIYNHLCGACHGSGAGGAPKLERGAWQPRIAQGADTLVQHAIDGYQGQSGVMPPRGGNPALSDEQVRATVAWMLDNLR